MLKVTPEISKLFTVSGAVYYVGVEEGGVLIDCGHAFEKRLIEKQLKEPLKKGLIKAVLITHDHPDHSGNAPFFQERGALICCHEDDFDGLDKPLRKPPFKFRRRYPVAKPFFMMMTEISPRVKIRGDRPLKEGEEFMGFKVIHLPGHTRGSAAYLHIKSSTLFTGDALLTAVPPWTMRGGLTLPEIGFSINYAAALDSLRKLLEINFENLCAGHGKPIVGGADSKVRAFLERNLS